MHGSEFATTLARAGSRFALAVLVTIAGCAGTDDASRRDSAAPSGAADAPAAGENSADLRDVTRYELSMDKIDKYYAAMRNMALAMKGMSAEEREKLDMDAGDDLSLDDYAAKLEREPAVRRAIEQAGLSTREFALLTMSMVQTGLASAVLAMRPKDNADSLMREMKVNPDNVRFLREHEAELKTKQQAAEREMKALGVTQ
jgi:hypothetical protein